MARQNLLSNLVNGFFKFFFGIPENPDKNIGEPKKILIIRQHNQLGDLLAGVSLFRALKENYPQAHITLIVSPANKNAVIKNKLIDEVFVFDKARIFNPTYLLNFWKLLRKGYDICIVPVVVSISFTSNMLARFSNSKIRIGPRSLDGKVNYSQFFFDRRVDLDWRKHPDSNVADRILDLVRPFGIDTKNFQSEITFDREDEITAEKFISNLLLNENELLIGLHVGAGKPQNRWSCKKYAELIDKINKQYNAKFYITGWSDDKKEIDFIKKNLQMSIETFWHKKITEVAALISKSDFFITNDTGIMHVAGITNVPQISIFGPTNPFNWAPLGSNKYFIRKSELIDDISVDDVFELFKIIVAQNSKVKSIGSK
jgi:heptosyltransferase-2